MKKSLKLKMLLKESQLNNMQAWKDLKSEVESAELPEGVNTELIEKSASDAKVLKEKGNEAKQAAASMQDEDKKTLNEIVNDPEALTIMDSLRQNSITSSEAIDRLFLKVSSKYIGEKTSLDIIKDINIYRNLNKIENKIASKNNIMRDFYEKRSIFDILYKDAFIEKPISKNAQTQKTASLFDSVKSIGSKVVSKGWEWFKYPLKILGTAMPFIGVFLSARDAYESFLDVSKSCDYVKKQYADISSDDNIMNGDYIDILISKYRTDPEKLKRIAQLNKVAEFYKINWYDLWLDALWFISDLILSVGIVISMAGTAGVGATITVPLGVMAERILGITIARVSSYAGGASLVGTIASHFFGVGLGTYQNNKLRLKEIAETNISTLENANKNPDNKNPDGTTNQENDMNSPIKNVKNFFGIS